MKKFAFIVAALAMLPAMFGSTSVFADSPGQLSNGASNYKVRNVTINGDYSQSISAVCNDTVKYSITLSNSDFGLLKDVTVKANLGSGAISASATNAAKATTSVSGKATVSSEGTLNYIAGSTVRISSDNKTRTPLSDGVTTNGVNAGDLNGSTAVFVQFEAKVACDTPKVTQIKVCELATKKVVTINENDFDSKKYSKDLKDCAATPVAPTTPEQTPATPAELPHTGPATNLLALAGIVALTAGTAYFVQSRRNTLG